MMLLEAIEQSYTCFSAFSRPKKLRASPLRDAEQILQSLTSAPLRELTSEQIGPYAGWAITTVGDDRDYRHFLPRIFELSVSDPSWLGAEPAVMASKLNMANWRTWPADQQAAISGFFRSAFGAVLGRHPDEGHHAEDWFCGIASLGEPIAPNSERWLTCRCPTAALHLSSFISREADHIRRSGEVRGSSWKDLNPSIRSEVAEFLTSSQIRDMIAAATGLVSDDDQFYFLETALIELDRRY